MDADTAMNTAWIWSPMVVMLSITLFCCIYLYRTLRDDGYETLAPMVMPMAPTLVPMVVPMVVPPAAPHTPLRDVTTFS
jgi:hypothetical protein